MLHGPVGPERAKLLADPGPWLCHYCGDCSENCPRQAFPGEAMMALRRYLTAQYDWTGLSGLMYRSVAGLSAFCCWLSLVVVLLFTVPASFGFGCSTARRPAAARDRDAR